MYNIKTILAHPDKTQLRIMSEVMRHQSNGTARIEILSTCEDPESLYQAIFRFAPDLIIMDGNLLTPCINVLAGKCEVVVITEDRNTTDSSNVHYAYVPVQPPELVTQALSLFAMITEEDYKNRESQVPTYLHSLGLPQKYCSAIDAFCYENRILTRNGVTPFAQRKRVMDSIANGALPLERVKQRHVGTEFDPNSVYNPYAMRLVDDVGEVQAESIFSPVENPQAIHPAYQNPSMQEIPVSIFPTQPVPMQPPQSPAPAAYPEEIQNTYQMPTQHQEPMIPQTPTQPFQQENVQYPVPEPTQGVRKELGQAAQQEVEEPKQHLEFLREPTKTQYVVGEKIKKEELLVKLVEPNGSFVLVRDFELSPSGPISENDSSVQISYNELTLSYPITVVDKLLMAVVINSMPKKLDYICGTKELDLEGGTLAVFFSDATNMQVDMTPDMIEGFDSNKVGRQVVNVCYRDKKLPMQITVRSKNIVKVEAINQPDKKEYTEGERLDTTGLVLRVSYDNGDEEFITDYECPDIKVQKDQAVVKMDYKGNIFPVFIRVRGCVLTGIRMEALPEKLSYLEKRDMLDVTGGRVARILSNGETEIVPLEMRMVSGFNNQRIGPCRVVVNLDDFQCFFEVQIVEREVAKLEVVHKPHKVLYFEQESFEPEGLEIKAQYNNNTFERVEGFEYEPKILDCNTSEVIISYRGKFVSVPVQVQMRMVESVSIAKMPDKTHFKEGRELLDVSGGKLLVIFNNGSADTIDMYEDMVEGFDNMKAGDNLLTVRYQDKTTQYHVVIDPKVLIGISITKMPDKTVYQKNDIADMTGMKLVGFYDNSAMTEIEHYAYQPNGLLQMEDTAIIVSYMDKIAVVPITVVEKVEEPEQVSEPAIEVAAGPVIEIVNTTVPETPESPVIEMSLEAGMKQEELTIPILQPVPMIMEDDEPEISHEDAATSEIPITPAAKESVTETTVEIPISQPVKVVESVSEEKPNATTQTEPRPEIKQETDVHGSAEDVNFELDGDIDCKALTDDDEKFMTKSEEKKPKNVRFYAGTGDLRFKNDDNYKMFA